MKNYFMIAALLVAAFGFSQEKAQDSLKTQTYSLSFSGIEIGTAGISAEAYGHLFGVAYGSLTVEWAYNIMTYDNGAVSVDGTGQQISFGTRTYYGKEKAAKGFYTGNAFTYGWVDFEEDFFAGKFEGKYRYISLFNPEMGYKIMLGKVSIDPFAGIMWKIQIKGKGDIDNKFVDVWMPRFGLKVGYDF